MGPSAGGHGDLIKKIGGLLASSSPAVCGDRSLVGDRYGCLVLYLSAEFGAGSVGA